MTSISPHYHAYLLRVWQVETDDGFTWRASLENVHTGERHGFASLESLFEFLNQLASHQDESAHQSTSTIQSN